MFTNQSPASGDLPPRANAPGLDAPDNSAQNCGSSAVGSNAQTRPYLGNTTVSSNGDGWAVPGVDFPRAEAPKFLSTKLEHALALAADAAELLAELAQGEFPGDDGYALINAESDLRLIEGRIFAARLAMLPKIDSSTVWKLDYLGTGRFNTWLAQHDGVERGVANREVKLANQLCDVLSVTKQRLLAGQVSICQARMLANIAATSKSRIAALYNPVTGWEAGEAIGADAAANENDSRAGSTGSEVGDDNCGTISNGQNPGGAGGAGSDEGAALAANVGRDTGNPLVVTVGSGEHDVISVDGGERDGNSVGEGFAADGVTDAAGCDGKDGSPAEGGNDAADNTVRECQIPTGEVYLLDMAAALPLYQFRHVVNRFAHISDPEADERGYKEAEAREFFEISQTMGGYHLAGFLTEEHGQQLKVTIDNLVSAELNEHGDIITELKRRSLPQRRAHALADLARLAMDTGLLGWGATERRQVTLTVSYSELKNLTREQHVCPSKVTVGTWPPFSTEFRNIGNSFDNPTRLEPVIQLDTSPQFITSNQLDNSNQTKAGNQLDNSNQAKSGIRANGGKQLDVGNLSNGGKQLDFGDRLDIGQLLDSESEFPTYSDGRGPIPRTVLKRMLCDCNLRRIVFGPESQVLDVGRTQRTVPPHIRTAVIARDKGCVFPGCDQPVQRCEVHHAIKHWADGGETSVENSALLCWHHHGVVDGNDIKMKYNYQTKNWNLTTKHGQPLLAKPPR